MVFQDLITGAFINLVPHISWYSTVLIGAMLAGVLVKQGEGWGKLFWSDKFQSKRNLFIWFIIEIVLIAVGAIFVQWLIQSLLTTYITFMISFLIQLHIFLYLLFSHKYGYKILWLWVLIFEIAVFGIAYLINYL